MRVIEHSIKALFSFYNIRTIKWSFHNFLFYFTITKLKYKNQLLQKCFSPKYVVDLSQSVIKHNRKRGGGFKKKKQNNSWHDCLYMSILPLIEHIIYAFV